MSSMIWKPQPPKSFRDRNDNIGGESWLGAFTVPGAEAVKRPMVDSMGMLRTPMEAFNTNTAEYAARQNWLKPGGPGMPSQAGGGGGVEGGFQMKGSFAPDDGKRISADKSFFTPPTSGLDAFYEMNPDAATAAEREGMSDKGFAAFPRRETGGPVKAGQPYIVGEKRAEVFIPNQDGFIEPDASEFGFFPGKGTVELMPTPYDAGGSNFSTGARGAYMPYVVPGGAPAVAAPAAPAAVVAPVAPAKGWQPRTGMDLSGMEWKNQPGMHLTPEEQADQDLARVEKELGRTPEGRFQLLAMRAKAQNASADRAARQASNVFLEQGRNARADQSVASSEKRAEDARAVEMNWNLYDQSVKMAMEYEKRNAPAPGVTVTPIDGTDYVIPFAGSKAMGTLPTAASAKAVREAKAPETVRTADGSMFQWDATKKDWTPFEGGGAKAAAATKVHWVETEEEGEDGITKQVKKPFYLSTNEQGVPVMLPLPMGALSQSPLAPKDGVPSATAASPKATTATEQNPVSRWKKLANKDS